MANREMIYYYLVTINNIEYYICSTASNINQKIDKLCVKIKKPIIVKKIIKELGYSQE